MKLPLLDTLTAAKSAPTATIAPRLVTFGLVVGKHAEGYAGFHVKVADGAHHVEDLVELRPVLDFTPRAVKHGAWQRFIHSGSSCN